VTLPVCDLGPDLIRGFWADPSRHPERDLDRFSRFSTADGYIYIQLYFTIVYGSLTQHK